MNIELTSEEMKIIRVCIYLAINSITEDVVTATSEECKLVEKGNKNKIYMKFEEKQ